MKWLVYDSLSTQEQYFGSHLSSYSHYLREAGEDVNEWCLSFPTPPVPPGWLRFTSDPDVVFALDRYEQVAEWTRFGTTMIAQIAARVPVMPWNVRRTDGKPVYDLILSSIPAMVEEARAAGCRAEYMPLAFDTRARVCGMGVKRDLDCIFIGTVGSNHARRTKLLEELRDVVTVMPPVFGREYFRTLARARVVFDPHAEWSAGAANNMRMFEAAGMGCEVMIDGHFPRLEDDPDDGLPFGYSFDPDEPAKARSLIRDAIDWWPNDHGNLEQVLAKHTYEHESRIPRLIELARSL